jgi:site-specific DNA recombinase
MGAARKRGKWLGSRPPLGYLGDRERMRLVVVPDEAEQVRTMFQLYLRLGSAAEVARRINELGWQRKTTRTRAGREVGGGAWTEKDVYMLLRNPIYLGKVDFKGERYEGEHEAIVDAPLFERVQRTLDVKACGPRRGRNPEYLLQSLLYCGLCGQPMTTTAGKGRSGEVYRYYACRNRARKTEDRCEHPRLSAPEVEEPVLSRVRHVCADRAMREQIAARIQEQRAEAEATRLALRAEADKLMRSLGHEASGRASHLLAERIGAIEAELEPVHARIAQLDAQMQALQQAAEQVTQTIRILEVFDEAWAAFNAAERQELVLIPVEKVVVNEPAGKLDIVFHDLGGPFDAAGDTAPEVAATEETPA